MFVEISVFPLWSLPRSYIVEYRWEIFIKISISILEVFDKRKHVNIDSANQTTLLCSPFLCPSLHWGSTKFTKLHIWAIPSSNNNNNCYFDNNMIHVLEHALAKLTTFVIPIEHWGGLGLPSLFYKFKITLPHDFIRNLEEWTFGPSIHLYGSRQIGPLADLAANWVLQFLVPRQIEPILKNTTIDIDYRRM